MLLEEHNSNECDDSKAVRTALNIITKLQKENKKKDKIIKYIIAYILFEPIFIYLCYYILNNCITTIK